jgi:hypothetical protein
MPCRLHKKTRELRRMQRTNGNASQASGPLASVDFRDSIDAVHVNCATCMKNSVQTNDAAIAAQQQTGSNLPTLIVYPYQRHCPGASWFPFD